MLPSAPPWLHLLRRRGVLAGSLLGIVGASLGVALLFGAVPGLDGPVPALAVAALLSLLLGAPLLWSLHRLATDAAAVAVAPAPQRAHGERSEAVARAQFFAQAEREWARAGRYGQTVALALIEIDRFSLVNERYGPEAAQAALHELSRQVARTLRGTDLLARIGEAQLAVLLPHADATGTVDVADRIRERAAHLQVGVLGGVVRVTVSLGVDSAAGAAAGGSARQPRRAG